MTRPGGRRTVWLHRQSNEVRAKDKWTFGGPLKSHQKLLSERTRDNGLALSRAADLNIEEVSELFLWFKKNLWTMDLSSDPSALAQQTARRMSTNNEFKSRALRLIQDADFGITDIDVSKRDVFVLPDGVTAELTSVVQATEKLGRSTGIANSDLFEVHTVHQADGADAPVKFSLDEDESNGTRRFFALAGPILNGLDQGATLVVDELECSIHPLLARKLVELFQSPSVNNRGAQLIFATHDSTLMDLSLLRRDQIWLTNKRSDGSTELYSLYDLDERPRNNGAAQKNYLDGRYGAVPRFGPSFEDLEVS